MSFTALTGRYYNSKQAKIETGITERGLKLKLPHVSLNLGEYSQITTTDSWHGNLSVSVYILSLCCNLGWGVWVRIQD